MPRFALSALQDNRHPVPHEATLGLGGNLGDPPVAMARALKLLDGHDAIRVASVSRLYKTPPWGKTDQDWFYNCCAMITTTLKPHAVLDICLAVEKKLKRKRRERWGPRVIDIDVLTYDNEAVDEDGLTIPHPHMHERGFVLVPLSDIASDMLVSGKSVSQWAASCDDAGIEIASPEGNWWLEVG
jgi:2-amino-4-hydroxy-6-hydroxymethyldihydropteridine diphosphokinase